MCSKHEKYQMCVNREQTDKTMSLQSLSVDAWCIIVSTLPPFSMSACIAVSKQIRHLVRSSDVVGSFIVRHIRRCTGIPFDLKELLQLQDFERGHSLLDRLLCEVLVVESRRWRLGVGRMAACEYTRIIDTLYEISRLQSAREAGSSRREKEVDNKRSDLAVSKSRASCMFAGARCSASRKVLSSVSTSSI